MIYIMPKQFTTGLAVKMMINVAIESGGESGVIAYKLFDANNQTVTEGNRGIDAEYIAENYKDIAAATNNIAQYLGVVII